MDESHQAGSSVFFAISATTKRGSGGIWAHIIEIWSEHDLKSNCEQTHYHANSLWPNVSDDLPLNLEGPHTWFKAVRSIPGYMVQPPNISFHTHTFRFHKTFSAKLLGNPFQLYRSQHRFPLEPLIPYPLFGYKSHLCHIFQQTGLSQLFHSHVNLPYVPGRVM